MLKRLQEFFRKEGLMPDFQDALVFGGLGIACYGIAQYSVPAACVVGGGALFWLGVKKP